MLKRIVVKRRCRGEPAVHVRASRPAGRHRPEKVGLSVQRLQRLTDRSAG